MCSLTVFFTGVGATSLVALQAQVVKTQQQAQLIKEGKLDPEEIKERRKGRIALLQGKRNRGVDDRNEKDRLQVKVRIFCLLVCF